LEKCEAKGKTMEKEFLYVGHYIDTQGNYVLKVGTTNNLERRRKEHNRSYLNSPNHPRETEFEYDWHKSLSKWNTLRYEQKTKEKWKEETEGEYIRNDRFIFAEKPSKVEITIRKTYEIIL